MTRLAALCCMGLIFSVAACETESQRSVQQAEQPGKSGPADHRTSIVWLKEGADSKASEALRSSLGAEQIGEVFEAFGRSFTVDLPPEEVWRLFEKSDFVETIDHVEEDVEIIPFQPPRAGCSSPQPVSAAVNPPWGVKRVGGPARAVRNSVWIVDSGVEADYQNTYLNLDARAADCSSSGPCAVGVQNADDRSGHGTMIAGIVGGRLSNGRGVQGVVEGANIVPVKIYDPASGETEFMRNAVKGLEYIYAQQGDLEGDVVIISWGALVQYPLGKPKDDQVAVEQIIAKLVEDRKVRVVIAAGNLGPLSHHSDCPAAPEAGNLGGGYVQTITPARMRHVGVWTVSAIDQNSDFWFFRPTDQCPASGPEPGPVKSPWGSFFGNNHPTRKMPPHFAEPGVNIQSLWIKNGVTDQVATCTGTSFAAPHLAGVLLLRPTPDTGGIAKKDPTTDDDPVGVCRKTSNANCTYVGP